MASNDPSQTIATPVTSAERITLIDSLRGFAILGILLMNIPAFSLPVAGHDPSVLNEFGTIDYKFWYAVEWFPEGTQRALFSLLFGAGILLFIGRQEKKLDGLWPADYFVRRQLWLMVFSLIDVYILLWFGDILFDYACLGLIMFAFRRLSPKKLLIAAGVCFLFMLARENRDLYLDKKLIWKGEVAAVIDTTITKLTPRQNEDLDKMMEFKTKNEPEKKLKRMKMMVGKMTGSYEDLYETRTGLYLDSLVRYLYFSLWDVLLFMFIGMAFFKLGILTGQAPLKLYVLLAVIGLGVGLTLSYFRLQPMIDARFNWFNYTKNISFSFYELSRTFRALGIFGTLMLLYKSGWFKWLFALMRAPGQMAFTNYLGQSIICGIYFYGIGFGMMGKLARHEIYYFVGIVWIAQIIFSHIWLRYFCFGPLEWLWRSLTYWKKPPFRRRINENV